MSSLVRALVVDDEPAARERLIAMLGRVPGYIVVGEAVDGEQAGRRMAELKPDVVFLDISMPRRSGLDVLRDLPLAQRPAIILVTAHTEFAIDAFDLDVADYILKPFGQERLLRACLRVQPGNAAREPERGWIAARDGRDLVRVLPADVSAVIADGNYVRLLTTSAGYIVRSTLHAMEEQVRVHGFHRTSRSSLVNIGFIDRIEPTGHGDAEIRLTIGQKVPLSRSFRSEIESVLTG